MGRRNTRPACHSRSCNRSGSPNRFIKQRLNRIHRLLYVSRTNVFRKPAKTANRKLKFIAGAKRITYVPVKLHEQAQSPLNLHGIPCIQNLCRKTLGRLAKKGLFFYAVLNQQNRAEVIRTVGNKLLNANTVLHVFIKLQKRIGGIPLNAKAKKLVKPVNANKAKLVADFFVGNLATAKSRNLVKKRVAVAHTAAAFPGNPVKRLVISLNSALLCSKGKLFLNLFHRNQAEVELLAAGLYGSRNLLKLRSGKNKDNVWRRLLNCL